MESIIELTENQFWKDVISSVQHLWDSDVALDKDVILNPPPWYNKRIERPLKRDWLENGILTMADLLDTLRYDLLLEELQDPFGFITDFMEYHNICLKVELFL